MGAKWKQDFKQTKWGKNGSKVGPKSGTRMGTKWEQEWERSGNKNPKVGQEWEQSGTRMETRTTNWGKSGARIQNWDKNGKVGTKKPKVGQEWKQSGSKNPQVTKWDQEPQSGTRMGTKWNKNLKVAQESHFRIFVPIPVPSLDSCSHFVPILVPL